MMTLASAFAAFIIVRVFTRWFGAGRLCPFIAAGVTVFLTGMLLSTADPSVAEVPPIAVAVFGTLFGVVAGVVLSVLSKIRRHVFSSAL